MIKRGRDDVIISEVGRGGRHQKQQHQRDAEAVHGL
jgi:hypothetical protein